VESGPHMSVQDLTSELSHRMRNRRVEEFLPTWLIPEAEENAWFHIYIWNKNQNSCELDFIELGPHAIIFCLLCCLLPVLLRLLSGDKSKHSTLFPYFLLSSRHHSHGRTQAGRSDRPEQSSCVPPEQSSMPSRLPPPR
jgi:hypothetical protein